MWSTFMLAVVCPQDEPLQDRLKDAAHTGVKLTATQPETTKSG